MAEALVAFSLAANILPFIEVAGRVISMVWKVYKGQSVNRDLFDTSTVEIYQNLTMSLKDILNDLKKSEVQCNAMGGLTKDSQGLKPSGSRMPQLAQDCVTVAEELLNRLQSVSLTKNEKNKNALWLIFSMTWEKKEIERLETRLNGLKEVLNFELLLSKRFVALSFHNSLQSTSFAALHFSLCDS